MSISPRLRKLSLTMHVASSVGWLGAVLGFLALALATLITDDSQTVRGAAIAMEVIGTFVLIPLSLASLLTGLVQSLGTPWGLVRHYWVIFKLIINVFASVVLLMYVPTLTSLGTIAMKPSLSDANLSALQTPSPLLHSGAALLLLLVATILSVYKPKGLTKRGRRKNREGQLIART